MRSEKDEQVSRRLAGELSRGTAAVRIVILWDDPGAIGGWTYMPLAAVRLIPNERKLELARAQAEVWERDQYGEWWFAGLWVPYLDHEA